MAQRLNTLRITGEGRFNEVGDMSMKVKWVYPSEEIYTAMKSEVPNPYVMARRFLGANARWETEDIKIAYDDSQRCMDLSCRVLGAATWRNNRWESRLGKSAELLFSNNERAIFLSVASPGSGSFMVETDTYFTPPGATDLKFDRKGFLTYGLARTAPAGAAALEVNVTVKPRVMSAVYKIYGNTELDNGRFWVAKTVFKNTGRGDVRNLKTSYKLGEYTSWSTPVTYPLLPAGGAIVDCYYPVLQAKIAELTTPTPQDLEIKYSYTDAEGKTVEETSAERIEVLGRSQMVFSDVPQEDQRAGQFIDWHANDPLWVVFVTSMDSPVREFAGMASRLSGGAGAAIDDDSAVRFCRAVYDLEVANGISYQTPAGEDPTLNVNLIQEVKYPRDVLRDRSGTCVDLAILYAAVCESVGLKTAVISISGHTFPVITLPSGTPFCVESTCVGGSAVGRYGTFEYAVQAGVTNLMKLRPGHFSWVDVGEWRRNGVIGPELPALPAGVLMKDWKYKDTITDRQGAGGGQGPTSGNAGAGTPEIFRGSYSMDGTQVQAPMEMTIIQNGADLAGQMSLNNGVLQGNHRGAVSRKAITLVAELRNQHTGQRLTVEFSGSVQGDAIAGRWRNNVSESGQFRVSASGQ